MEGIGIAGMLYPAGAVGGRVRDFIGAVVNTASEQGPGRRPVYRNEPPARAISDRCPYLLQKCGRFGRGKDRSSPLIHQSVPGRSAEWQSAIVE